MRLLLEPADRANGLISCDLIAIERSQIHLNAKQWIKPGTRASLKFDRIRLAGEVGYCNRQDDEYRTCFVVGNNRRAPRYPIDEAGSITVLGDEKTASCACRLTDISRFGLSLDAAAAVKVGSMVCVQTDFMLAIGEVRHQMQNPDGTLHMGIEITDMLSDDTAPRHKMSLRHRFAEFILGRPIGAL